MKFYKFVHVVHVSMYLFSENRLSEAILYLKVLMISPLVLYIFII
jgi:hypothetical protein